MSKKTQTGHGIIVYISVLMDNRDLPLCNFNKQEFNCISCGYLKKMVSLLYNNLIEKL